MTSPEKAAQKIFGERAAHYATSATHTDAEILARVVELARPFPTARCLDVATGAGHTALALAPRCAAVVATDLTREMLREARTLAGDRGIRNVFLHQADVHRLPYRSGSFDIVTSRRAPHHFSNIDAALAEMRRVLAPEGRLVLDDRSVPEDDFVDATMNELDRLHDESHVRQYRPSEWRAMLEKAGFVIDSLEPYTKHRPLTSLTEGVSPANVRRIEEILAGMSEPQRSAFRFEKVKGELHLTHWYVMIAARPPASSPR